MYEQNRGLRVLIRRLLAGQEVAIRLEGDPAPPAAPGPSCPRIAPVLLLALLVFQFLDYIMY